MEFKIREMEGEKRELYHVKKPDDVVRLPLCPLSAPLPLPLPLTPPTRLASAGRCNDAMRWLMLTVLARAPRQTSDPNPPARRTQETYARKQHTHAQE